jgi:peptidyl-prolyl cis-trans isomerase B (cyclophilin B)
MILDSLLLALPVLFGAGGPEVQWSAPSVHVTGRPYEVEITITAPEDGTLVAGWLLSPSAFTIDGEPAAPRQDTGTVQLPAGFTIHGKIDLDPHLPATGELELAYARELLDQDPVRVRILQGAPPGLDFMTLPVEQLSAYQVLLQTVRGEILLEVWPVIAPNHARNFLDLAYTGFYDGTIFHRVMPGFMIQGGDPTGTGSGDGPRRLKAEFDASVKHVPGVLSMARGEGLPDSASCQFFIMHGEAPHLNGQYSAFGKLLVGADVVDAIARTPARRENRPETPQTIVHAVVVTGAGGQ